MPFWAGESIAGPNARKITMMKKALIVLGLTLLPALALAQAGATLEQAIIPPSNDNQAADKQKLDAAIGDRAYAVPGGTIARSARQRATDVIYAVDFGVTCDGLTGADQTAAIMAATNAAVALGGRDVVFPPGTCRIRSYMVLPSKTRWVSRSGTVFYLDPAMTTGYSVANYTRAIVFDAVSEILIDGLTFQGAGIGSFPCPAVCTRAVNIVFRNTNHVTIRNTVIQDFGWATTADIPAAGIQVFGGHNYLIDNVTIQRTSGDNLAFSNGVYNVEVRGSTFAASTGDSALVCTIGGYNHNYHGNRISGTEENVAPVIVMDRCWNWAIANNQVYGGNVGQGIRVARYEDTGETNHDFTISGNVISRSAQAISVETAATKQGSQATAGGGRFSITGNTIINPTATGIVVADSEVGTITGNVISRAPENGILIAAYTSGVNTGTLAVSGNTIASDGGTYGIRQLSAGGKLTPIALGGNVVTGATIPYSLADGNSPQVIPYGTPPSSSVRCAQSQIFSMDASYLYLCAGTNALKRVPLSSF